MKLFNFVFYLQIFIFTTLCLHQSHTNISKHQKNQKSKKIERQLLGEEVNQDALNLANSLLKGYQTKDLHIDSLNFDTPVNTTPIVHTQTISQKVERKNDAPQIGDILHLKDQLERLIKYRKNLDLINHQLETKIGSIERQTKFAQSQNSLFDYRISKMMPIAKQVTDRKLQVQNNLNQQQVKLGNLQAQSSQLQRNLQSLLQQEKLHQQIGTNYLINYQNTQTQIQNVKNQIGDIENQIMATETQISKKNQELNEKKQRNLEIQKQIDDVKQKVEKQNKKLTKKSNRERKLNDTVEEKEARRQILIQQYNDFKNEMQQLTLLKKQITDLRSQFAQKQAIFKQRKQDTYDKNEKLTQEIAELKQKEEELKTRESNCECSFETIQKFVTDKDLDEVQEGAMKICISQTIHFILSAHNNRILNDLQPKAQVGPTQKQLEALQRLQSNGFLQSSSNFGNQKI